MKVIQTIIKGCSIVEPIIHGDNRGFFMETFQEKRYKKDLGIKDNFVQDNYSRSEKGVLRGLHLQKNKPQGKLIRVVRGEVFDVAVDLRKNSETYGKWISTILSEKNKRQLWIPKGFAHGFQVISDIADLEYKVTDHYDPEDEICISWDDPDLNIKWPIRKPNLSEKDSQGELFKNIQL